MEGLLDFTRPIDVALLDEVVTIMYAGSGPEQQRAQKTLAQLQEHPDAWQRVDKILEGAKNPASRYIGLQILERLVQSRWNALPRPQCEGIKNYIVGLIIRNSSDDHTMQQERVFLNKLNLLLVQILKHEWPRNWPNFIGELVGAGRTSLTLCENNMVILRLLSEEVFDYSAEQMTTVKAKSLKQQLCGEFAEVFQLCSEVLEHASRQSLLMATLQALLRFLKWIPLGYIFETSLIQVLVKKYFSHPAYRNLALGCLTEIAALQVGADLDYHFVQLFEQVMAVLQSSVLPFKPDADYNKMYGEAGEEEQRLVQNLAMFLSTILSGHLTVLESSSNPETLTMAHLYLLKVSSIDDREVFKVCLEYWNKLVSGLYSESPYSDLLALGSNTRTNRRQRYKDILSQLRVITINSMVKPEEVLIVEDENGNIVREQIKETDTIVLYKSIRELLVFLTHLDVEDTEKVMTEKLSRQLDNSEWSWTNLNKLCWAVGSISGAMNEEVEKRFLVQVIRDLLGLVEMKRGKDNKAVVAANIMYIVGQYPRFLRAHWKFLKTVVNKLFEFMHELHEGVQDMACDTFIKIVRKCRRHFVFSQPGETRPFIEEILERLPSIICDLGPGQVHVVYRAIGCMLEADSKDLVGVHLSALMALPNDSWDQIINAVSRDSTLLQDTDTCKSLSNILKCNIAVCSTAMLNYTDQLSRLFMDMLSLYRNVSGLVSEAVKRQGQLATRTPIVRAMRTVKKDCLRLLEQYVDCLGNSSDYQRVFCDQYVSLLFEAILTDYRDNVPSARDAEVLSLTGMIIQRLGSMISDQVDPILSMVFEPTLAMISQDFAEYPDHRQAFYTLLRAVNKHCFGALLRMSPDRFKLTVDCVLWAVKHTAHRDICDLGLQILLELLENMTTANSDQASAFYSAFYFRLLQDLFAVVFDSDHRAGFKYQCVILSHLFRILPTIRSVLIFKPPLDNEQVVKEYLQTMLSNAYSHLQRQQIDTFIKGLFDLNANVELFMAHVKDFLIAMREYGNPGDSLVFEEERELEEERRRQVQAQGSVPGLVKLDHDEDGYEETTNRLLLLIKDDD